MGRVGNEFAHATVPNEVRVAHRSRVADPKPRTRGKHAIEQPGNGPGIAVSGVPGRPAEAPAEKIRCCERSRRRGTARRSRVQYRQRS